MSTNAITPQTTQTFSWLPRGFSTKGLGNRVAQSFYTIPNTIWMVAGAAASPWESAAGFINFFGGLTRAALPNSPTNLGIKVGASAGFISLAVATAPKVGTATLEVALALPQALHGNLWSLGSAAYNLSFALAPDATIGLAQYLDFRGGRFKGQVADHKDGAVKWFWSHTSNIGGALRGVSRFFPLTATGGAIYATGALAQLAAFDPVGFVATAGVSNLVGLAIYGSLLTADILYTRYANPKAEVVSAANAAAGEITGQQTALQVAPTAVVSVSSLPTPDPTHLGSSARITAHAGLSTEDRTAQEILAAKARHPAIPVGAVATGSDIFTLLATRTSGSNPRPPEGTIDWATIMRRLVTEPREPETTRFFSPRPQLAGHTSGVA